ncbi:MAG: PTS fructose transporter subunit IIA [Nitrospirae bacterium CG_4_9_14_3_um_filter_53_35]|nr:MAG: hypothetical protein AUK29_06320 [Nitrospirae bacterium CG2_30_53_67]PIS36469.1 MAG: PTS fructose transporter subunit IIA [Nitrospirae bacterium CG08_land_8_20_14_0_20_52_24]PIW85611.1 MAG: PTS fructose transporter subunit IIA [Nitrospirae bacterium CG_4_8_14_3_um_filter_50_41]PIX84679.1 MAG: PTS fructose transporter subunit IIA [Nitrospirae bacterium CG_4_10_14_3_um_filter_53_41]PJA75014.1 MAG: PTS fructose transporter subunit IIA [Nitrospirae bacterium CG_4_9_14_3_um_filter_53_35]
MVGFVMVTHAHIGDELNLCVEGILGKQEGVLAVSVDFTKAVDAARAEIAEAVKAVDQGDGVIIMTDMLGGTPSNISLAFLENPKVEVITGVNLPMLIKGITLRKDHQMAELCGHLEEYGKRGIIVASTLLKEQQGRAV